LNTIYENIQYVQTHATNDYGTCGIKVWVNYATK
jgi:ribosomal protein S3